MGERSPVIFLLEREIDKTRDELQRSEEGIESWMEHIRRESKRIEDMTAYIQELQDALDKIRNGSL